MLETFFRSALNFSTCSIFFALLTGMIQSLKSIFATARVGTGALRLRSGQALGRPLVILSETLFVSRRTWARRANILAFLARMQNRASGALPCYALAAASIGAVSSKIPGPMVELRVQPLMYLPLATDGLALITLVISTVAFSINLSGENEIFPTGTWTSAVLSVRNSTLLALTSCTALATSTVTVPVFGFGIRPLGPRILPRRPTDFITSG